MDNTEYEAITDAKNAHRLHLPVAELEHLAAQGDDTPASGDALAVYGAEPSAAPYAN